MEVDDESIPQMEPKVCSSCRAPHFEDYDLCSYCSAEKQYELERRLTEYDNARPFMSIAVEALFGREQRKVRAAWRIR